MTSSSLQNMAPNVQRALFIALVFGAIAVVVYMFCELCVNACNFGAIF